MRSGFTRLPKLHQKMARNNIKFFVKKTIIRRNAKDFYIIQLTSTFQCVTKCAAETTSGNGRKGE